MQKRESALSGCIYDVGRPGDGATQPLAMNALAVVSDVTQLRDYICFYGGDQRWRTDPNRNFIAEMRRAGIEPSYNVSKIFYVRGNVINMMCYLGKRYPLATKRLCI